ncbi:MAG: DnaB-like helicase C-terminal domain-containing protein, partial [Lachnospiraceae bacterium]|nr:DnaB-like helicase C-terminal domain-containing protein [Lachnospiraceae bacterium]
MLSLVNGRNVNSFNIHGGQLVVVASRPSMGKSLFMLNQIKYLCGEKGEAALVISLDESKDKLVERLMSLCGGVDSDSMHSGNLSDNDWESIIKSANNILEWRLVIEDESIPLESICERIRAMKNEKSISVAFIDYIQLIGCNRNVKSRNEEIGYIMSELKNVAMELDIPI